jgi:lysozyme family protein
MLVYKVNFCNDSSIKSTRIAAIEAMKVSNKSFWTKDGLRHNKKTVDYQVFDSLPEAKGFALKTLNKMLEQLKKMISNIDEGISAYTKPDYEPERMRSIWGGYPKDVPS